MFYSVCFYIKVSHTGTKNTFFTDYARQPTLPQTHHDVYKTTLLNGVAHRNLIESTICVIFLLSLYPSFCYKNILKGHVNPMFLLLIGLEKSS